MEYALDTDPDFFEPAEVAALLRRVAPAQSHELRRAALDVAKFLDGIEVPTEDNPVVISVPVRHDGHYVGWLNTCAWTYTNDAGKLDMRAETHFMAMSQQEREEYNHA
jgi:hypothetical protein